VGEQLLFCNEPPFLAISSPFLKKTIFKKKIMSASKGRRMTTIKEREERFKKADDLLKTTKNQFPSHENNTAFTAFVDMKTWRAIEGHIHLHGGYGDGVTNENGFDIIKYGDWRIIYLYSSVDNRDKIKILTFPGQGSYCDAE
jgi:hypothetical protein